MMRSRSFSKIKGRGRGRGEREGGKRERGGEIENYPQFKCEDTL